MGILEQTPFRFGDPGHELCWSVSMKCFLAGLALILSMGAVAQAGEKATPEDEKFIRQAIEIALSARKHGTHPFGALLVYEGKVLITAENSVLTEPNATGHAETNLVRFASKKFPSSTLEKCTLYTSTEPCAMCSAAIHWAKIPKVVYGCSARTLMDLAGIHDFDIPCREIFKKTNHPKVEVVGPVLEKEALVAHAGFWEKMKW
jgi:tRNA(Arg) A34 adenosine deaminase TadA